MAISVYGPGRTFANSLINGGHIDFDSDWAFSAADGNKLLGEDGDNWSNYAKHHLAQDSEAESETKDRFKYPFAKMKGDQSTIYRAGVIAAKSRAAQQGQDNVASAADALLTAIDEKAEDGDACGTSKKKKKKAGDETFECECIKCGHQMTSEAHCDELKCPECGGQMRRAGRPGPGKDKKDNQRVDFVDFMPVPTAQDGVEALDAALYSRMKRTSDGFLAGRAVVTNVGVFPYRMDDGTIRWELRPPEEVFHPDSLTTLKNRPMTDSHPGEIVNSENIRRFQVGNLGEEILTDAYRVSIPIIVQDAAAVEAVQEGKQALSCGYLADVEEKEGVWMGVPYQGVQRNIRYNHVAIVDRGRAGDAAVMRMDSVDGDHRSIGYRINDESPNSHTEEIMKKITLDGVEYQAEAEVIKALNTTQSKLDEISGSLDSLQKEKTEAEAKRDELSEQLDKAKKDLEEAQKLTPEQIDAAVKARMAILTTAQKADVEVKEDMSEMDLKKAVILKAFPNSKSKLDEADEGYINARFDGAVEHFEARATEDVENRTKLGGETPPDVPKEDSAEAARERMIERMTKGDSEQK